MMKIDKIVIGENGNLDTAFVGESQYVIKKGQESFVGKEVEINDGVITEVKPVVAPAKKFVK